MIFLLGLLLFILSGYALALLFYLTRDDLFYDLPLGWFLGLGFYGLGMLLYYCFFRENAGSVVSLFILLLPVMLAFLRYQQILEARGERLLKGKYVVGKGRRELNRLEKGILLFSLLLFLLISAHGISTPVSSDDALRVRAYLPMMLYKSEPMFAHGEMFVNGPLSNYAPQLFWQLDGGVDYFYIKYMNLVSFACFLVLLFRIPASHGNIDEGVYNVFLTLSLPFLVYHATSANLDLPMVIPFVLGFLVFSIYIESRKPADLNIAILFFTIAALVKTKGDMLAATGIGMIVIFIVVESMRKKLSMPWKSIFALLPFALFIFLKEYLSPFYQKRFIAPAEKAATFIGESINEAQQIGSQFAPGQKVYGFFHSMFLSGHFNILFYLLVGSMLFFAVRFVASQRLRWNLFFFSVVFLECYFYMAVRWSHMLGHQSIIHRVMILLAATGVVFLSSIWARREHGADKI